MEFGLRIKQLRQEQGLSKVVFCDDELELTVRQLRRIENEGAKPTFAKLEFIAKRLGYPTYQIMPDYQELSADYLALKYKILRLPTYGYEEKIEEVETYLDKIYEEFYDALPEEEKVAIDVAATSIDVFVTGSKDYVDDVLMDYFHQSILRKKYSVNDLLNLDLFMMRVGMGLPGLSKIDKEHYDLTKETLLQQGNHIKSEDLYLLRDAIISYLSLALYIDDRDYAKESINFLKDLMTRTQDFQKQPILKMLEWKYLRQIGDFAGAETCYRQSLQLAELFDDQLLVQRLSIEWETDLKAR